MTQTKRPATPTAVKQPPPTPEEDDDEFSEAGTLVIDEALDMHAELPDDGGEFAKFIKLVKGNNLLRFLPPQAGKTVPWVYTWQHGWGQGASYRTVNCPKMMSKPAGNCPICDERDRLLKTGREADKVSAGKLKAKLRVITEVVVMTTEPDLEKGVQLFAYGRKISDALSGILSAGARMGGDFTHKKTGFPILIVREGDGMDTEYPTISSTPQREPVEGAWLLDRTDLTRFTKLPTREEMSKAMQGFGLSVRSSQGAPPQGRPQHPAPPQQARRANVADSMNEVDDAGYQVDSGAYGAGDYNAPAEEVYEGDEDYQEPAPPPPPARRTAQPPRRQ